MPKTVDLQMSLQDLLKGYRDYKDFRYPEDKPLLDNLAREGQSPKALVISCCDSRVEPSAFLSTGPGDLFMVRNVANLVPPYEVDSQYHGTSAAVEYAVEALNVPHVIVMGHSHCGGIQALIAGAMDEKKDSAFIHKWISMAKGPCQQALEEGHEGAVLQERVEQLSVVNSMKNLRSFPCVQKREKDGTLQVHGWHFDFTNGQLCRYDSDRDAFVYLADLPVKD
ncbi:carbonic anhydrase [Kiloniella sp. b19]|uniref:carbonic anhydrase n=1 Tax=Kiloniella sp. GXU_MW_B19 TaxID=3141326 RepID=UPI0031D6D13B